MAGRFSVEAVIKAVDKVTAPVTRMQNSIGKFTRSTSDRFERLNKSVDTFSEKAKSAAKASIVAIALLTAPLVHAVQTGMEFEQTLVGAASKFGGIKKGSAVYKELELAARNAGRTTEFSASQSAEALSNLAASGLDVKTSIGALPLVIDLATAAQMDLGRATQIATDSMGAFGLMTKDPAKNIQNMTRVMDVMSMTADLSTLAVEDIFESIKKAGPLATAAGVSIETVNTMLGIMASNGIKAELAGTAVQNMLLNMAAPTSGATKTMKKLGLTFKDARGNFKDLPIIIDELGKSMANMTAPQKAAALQSLFGREGLGGVVAMVNAGSSAFVDFRKKLDEATGSTQQKATMMRDTVQGSFKSMMSAIEGVEISIFSMTEGGIKNAVDKTTEWIRANQDLIATRIGDFLSMIINNFESIVTWTARIAIGIGIFIAFVTVLKTFVLVMTAINLVMAMNPIGLMVLAVVALIAGLTALTVWLANIYGGFDKLAMGIGNTLSPLNLLMKGIQWLKDNASDIGGIFGFGDAQPMVSPRAQRMAAAPQMVSPQERVARSIEERRTTNSAEVTIMDQTGRARVTGGTLRDQLKIQPTGAF